MSLDDVLALAPVQSLLPLRGESRRHALLGIVGRLGAAARDLDKRAKGEQDWANLHFDPRFNRWAHILNRMLRQSPPFTPHDWYTVVHEVGVFRHISINCGQEFFVPMVAQLEKALEKDPSWAGSIKEPLSRFIASLRRYGGGTAAKGRLARRLEDILRAGGADELALDKATPLHRALLERENIELDKPSVVDQLLTGLAVPDQSDMQRAAAFSVDSLEGASEILAVINAELARAALGYASAPDAKKTAGRLRAAAAHMGLHGIAIVASAATAMSHRAPKFEFDNSRAERYHNGAAALVGVLPILLTAVDDNDPGALGELCWAMSRYADFEYVCPEWVEIAAAVANRAAPHLLGKPDKRLMLHLIRFRERLARTDTADTRASVRRFDERLGIGVGFPVALGERWSDRMYSDIHRSRHKTRWHELLQCCARARGSSPSARWLREITAPLSRLDQAELEQYLAVWFGLVGRPRPALAGGKIEGRDSSVPSEAGADMLRALAFVGSRLDTPIIARALGDLAMASYKMVPGVGARCIKAGNSAIWALTQLRTPGALTQLSRVRQLVKFGTAKKVLDTALARLSESLGVTPDELHEIAAPDFGFGANASVRAQAGEFEVELRVETAGAQVQVLRAGAPVKNLPAAVKYEHGPILKSLKQTATDINKVLPAQKDRIERLFHSQRSWSTDLWRQRYIAHPLVGVLARRLIWEFGSGAQIREGIWTDAGFVDPHGAVIKPNGNDRVQLWHPINASAARVLEWRNYLEKSGLRQPFKQAHREIYQLTDAERRTHSYSNRFAAHIIKQAQLIALCQSRGWSIKMFVLEYGESPRLWLPEASLYAHFEVMSTGDDTYGSAGASTYLETDRVRFTREPEGPDIPLEQVPPLTLSEVMRDVDLFVGVCSVGNNPAWNDGGPGGTYREYWQAYAFGDLSATGQTRHDLLSRLLPRLRIAEACTLHERFLEVRGKLRTYKIHLGSGNILMEPNDQYLCIVPTSRDEKNTSFIPFEGDRTLSIILSKAFLLADDDRITDTSITRQIRP